MESFLELQSVMNNIPLFLTLNSRQMEKIGEISSLVEILPGDLLIREGEKLDNLYILLEGECKVDVFIPSIGQVETSRLGPLDLIGWSAMTPMVRQRTATVTGLTHCLLLCLQGDLLVKLCEEDHDIGFIIYRRLANVVARSFLTTRLQLMNMFSDPEISNGVM